MVVLFYLMPSCQLVKTADRTYSEFPLSKQLKEQIVKETSKLPYDIDLMDYCLTLTSMLLEFSEKNDIENGKANCVGYTKLFTSIYNYALLVNKYEGRVKPVVGYVTWCGINLCDVAKFIVPKKYESFVKDHDFVELDFENYFVYVDPSLYDIMGSKCWTTVDSE